MILPTTYWAALLFSILSMLCWGSWANTYKLTASNKWRFELYYFDFAFGILLAATVAALTLGQFGTELSFMDNLSVTGKRQLAYAFVAGCVFNLANMLLLAGVSLAGLAVAYPIGMGMALIFDVVWSFALNPQGKGKLVFGGMALILFAIIAAATAYRTHSRTQAQATGKKLKGAKGIVISLFSGVLMGSFYPIIELARGGEIGLGGYTAVFFLAIGVLVSTPIYNIYLMNLPVQGKPVELGQYFRAGKREHVLGVIGGSLWAIGAVASFTSANATRLVPSGPAVAYAMAQGATIIAALWGLLYWKEFSGANSRARMCITLMLLFFVVGLTMLSLALLYAS